MLAEIEDFIEGFNQPTYRGMRVNGVRVALGPQGPGGPVIRGRMPIGSNKRRLIVVVIQLNKEPFGSLRYG
jgi:hypothetical protein